MDIEIIDVWLWVLIILFLYSSFWLLVASLGAIYQYFSRKWG